MTDPVHLSRFRADVSRALASRGKSLLTAPDLPARVRALEPLEAYFVVKELGVDDALPILRHTSPEQIQAFIDLDCWDGDQPDPIEIDAWLATFAAEGKASLAAAFSALEPEIQILFLKHAVRVWDARSDEVPPALKTTPRLTTPDGFFVIDANHSDRFEINVLSLLDGLYAHDVGEAFRLITAVKWELASPLAERAFQFRSNRLEDLGFPKPEDAHAIFAKPPAAPPPETLAPVPTRLPAIYAAPLSESSLLARALGRIGEPELLTTAESDLVYLINAAVIAFGEGPKDIGHVTDVAERVRDTVSLGLEVLIAGAEPLPFPEGEQAADRAAALLRTWPVREVFRHGHQVVAHLRTTAAALAEDPEVRAWLATVETDATDYGAERRDRELVRALLLPAPLYAGFDPIVPEKRKAFGSRQEVAAAEAALDRLARR